MISIVMILFSSSIVLGEKSYKSYDLKKLKRGPCVGRSPQAVIEILGRPADSNSAGGSLQWTYLLYGVSRHNLRVSFREGKGGNYLRLLRANVGGYTVRDVVPAIVIGGRSQEGAWQFRGSTYQVLKSTNTCHSTHWYSRDSVTMRVNIKVRVPSTAFQRSWNESTFQHEQLVSLQGWPSFELLDYEEEMEGTPPSNIHLNLRPGPFRFGPFITHGSDGSARYPHLVRHN